jgi:GNAT superfamily N-acetyltransferase
MISTSSVSDHQYLDLPYSLDPGSAGLRLINSLLRRYSRRCTLRPYRLERCSISHIDDPHSCVSFPYLLVDVKEAKLTDSILAPYRSLGLGRALLQNALRCAINPTIPPPPVPSTTKTNTRGSLTVASPRKTVNRAMAHVQVGNETAKAFYQSLGFKEDKV